MHKLDLSTYPRRDHFHFFRAFEEPFHGVTFRVEAGPAYDLCKREGHSFFLYYLHASLVVVNGIDCFRYRIDGEDIIVHDRADAGPTIGRADGTFGFGYFVYHPDFATFCADAGAEIARVRERTGLNPSSAGQNVIHYSSLPWLDFSSLSHARRYGVGDSCPKISFGKLTEDHDGKRRMAVSVHAHHALVDGRDVAEFARGFEERLVSSGDFSRRA